MMFANVLTLMFLGSGGLLIGLSIPLMRRSVKPNSLYGLRVAATFADEWVWYEANARSGRDFVVVGIVQIVLAIGLRFLPITTETYAVTNAGVLVVLTLCSAFVGWRRANRLLAEKTARTEPAGDVAK